MHIKCLGQSFQCRNGWIALTSFQIPNIRPFDASDQR